MCKTDAQPEVRDCVFCGEKQSAKKVFATNCYQCRVCRRQFTAFWGTLRHGSHLTKKQWDLAQEYVRNGGVGIGELARIMGCCRKSARRTMLRIKPSWKDPRGKGMKPHKRVDTTKSRDTRKKLGKRIGESERVTCTGCGREWERPFDVVLSAKCRDCRAKYIKEYKRRKKVGWEPDRRNCELCGRPMSPLSKRDSHPACAWWKMRNDSWAEQERKIQWEREQVERPTTPTGWLLRARRELGRARAALRDRENSATPSTPARISLTSCPHSSATS